MHSIDQGVGPLVDADMDEESTQACRRCRCSRQLGIQSLSIANQAARSTIMSLFQLS